MVKGDRKPSIQAQLKWADDTIPDLTNCTVKFHMKKGSDILVNANATIVSPATGGIVQYDWATNDVTVSGVCQGEFEITWPDGLQTTWPTEGNLEIIFREPYE
jgi:hypothetical protein